MRRFEQVGQKSIVERNPNDNQRCKRAQKKKKNLIFEILEWATDGFVLISFSHRITVKYTRLSRARPGFDSQWESFSYRFARAFISSGSLTF